MLLNFNIVGDQRSVDWGTEIQFDADHWSYDPDCGEKVDPDLPTSSLVLDNITDCLNLTYLWKCYESKDKVEPTVY